MNKMKSMRLAITWALALGLSACGGGGGDPGLKLPDLSTLSTPLTVTKAKSNPGEPQNTANVPLNWTASPDAATYAVHRCEVPPGITDTAAMIAASPVDACPVPIAVTTTPTYTDVPPKAAPTAYVYHVRACSDKEAKLCGPVVGSVVAALSVPAPVPQMTTVIGDDGRQVIAGLTATLHAIADGATGTVTWAWVQESGPKVTLVGADTPVLAFNAPDVGVNTLLSFELRTRDDNGPGRPSKVAVTVVPAANVNVSVGHASRLAQAGHDVSLHAAGSAPGLRYAWRQLSPASPVVALTGADTDNPSFVAPNLPFGGTLLFEVTATDPVTGRNASARTSVEVQYAVPSLVPNPVPGQVPQPIPVAAPLLQPLLMGQPLQVPQPTQAVPVPNPVLVPPLVPPQALVLVASPAVVATGGSTVSLAMVANGGAAPYQWSWTQTGGRASVLSGTTQPVLEVQVPTVTATETLTFEAELTDANGTRRTAQAVVQATVLPQPPAVGDPARAPDLVQAPRLITVNEAAPVFGTPWTEVSVVQQDGPQLTIDQQAAPGNAGTVIVVTAPLLKDDSAAALLRVTGKDSTGRVQGALVPLIVMRPPGTVPAQVRPPQVPIPTPLLVPRQDEPLVIVGSKQGTIDEGKANVGMALYARGGKGSSHYSFRWDYQKEPDGPDLVLRTPTRPTPGLDAPLVDRPTTLKFLFQVTDGVQVAQAHYTLTVNDLAPTETVGALVPLTVQSGHAVTLSMPEPNGGLPFPPPSSKFQYSVSQTGGPALPFPPLPKTSGPGNWGFNAPTLTAGAPNQVLTFALTATDRSGSAVTVTQEVTVTAPPVPAGPPIVATLSLPPSIGMWTLQLPLQGRATNGTPPYSYAWTVQPVVQVVPGRPAIAPAAITASGRNPTVNLPNLLDNFADIANYALEVSLRITDAVGGIGDARFTVKGIFEVVRSPSDVLLCGDLQKGTPCTDLDLVLAMTSRCPGTQPYAMNHIIQNGDQVLEFRACVDAPTAYRLWVLESSKNPQCLAYDSANQTQLTCHIACYGDGCNIDTNPPAETLVGPPGKDGFLTVGGREGVRSP